MKGAYMDSLTNIEYRYLDIVLSKYRHLPSRIARRKLEIETFHATDVNIGGGKTNQVTKRTEWLVERFDSDVKLKGLECQQRAVEATIEILDDTMKRIFELRWIDGYTPEEIAAILSKQALTIQEQIQQLSKSLQEIKLLKEEVLQMQQVDFKKYADIIVNLQMNNQYYWLIKHFDDSTLDHIRHRFNKDTGLSFIHRFNQLIEEILILKDNNVSPDNIEAQKAAQKFWNIVMEFTNGDMSLLPELMKFNDQLDEQNEWTKKQRIANEYIQPALEIYFQNAGVDPFKEQ